MSEMTNERLAAIRERLAAATPGPWFLDAGGDSGVYTEARESRTSSDVASAFHREDEVFIAHAPEDIAAVLAEVDRLTELNRSLSNQLVGMSDRLQQSAKQIAANAWDEGYGAGDLDCYSGHPNGRTKNPYKEARNATA